ncbi:probable ATP-dependent DNA helicase RecS [Montipora capricornis]|uniref:probable ATP-dependent DNA helicase RecS n=1 Tax=Montipora capricornis TaxID=246305 RepID=UPI0035F12FF4
MLMEDQVAYLKSLGLSATAVHDEQSVEILKKVEKGNFTYLFASPEKMLSVNKWRKLMSSNEYRWSLVAIAIDEAHCISQWGLSESSNQTVVPFRTWYGNLGELNSLTSDVPTIVLTATASIATRRDIFNTLNLKQSSCHIVERSPESPNGVDVSCDSSVALPESVSSVNEQDKQNLQAERFAYMKDLLICQTSSAVASLNLMREFPRFHIHQVLDNCHKIKTLHHAEEFAEIRRKEHGRAILAAINKIIGDIDSSELQIPETIEEESDIMIAEWGYIRDHSELYYISQEIEFEDVDVCMEEVDQSGNQHRSISSMIDTLFR